MQHDLPRAAELIDAGGSPDITPGPYMLHVHALIRGDIDRAFEFYAQALAERDPLAVLFSNGRANIHRLFPGFYGDPRFARLLEEVDLDPVSIVALNIPPIPDAQQLSD